MELMELQYKSRNCIEGVSLQKYKKMKLQQVRMIYKGENTLQK